jgi:hypothetical protein
MTRIFTTTLALVCAASLSALAVEPLSKDAEAGIAKALAEIGCTPGDHHARMEEGGVGYFIEGTTCKDGIYDIVLDNSFKVIDRK